MGPLDLLYTVHGAAEPPRDFAELPGLTMHAVHASRGVRRAATYARCRLAGTPRIYARGANPEIASSTADLIADPTRGLAVAGDLIAAAALLPLAKRHPIAYNAHNFGPTYFNPSEPPTAMRLREFTRFERRVLETFSESWMVSRRDLAGARALAPRARLRYVPNAVDIDAIKPVERPAGNGRRMLMVADFSYGPNRVGRTFMVDEVLPIVWRSVPDAELVLVGKGGDSWRPGDDRIRPLGFVEDLDAVYAEADCVVVPIRTGAGTPLKFVEALAYGVPTVATPFAAIGLDAQPDEHYLEGNDPSSFAAAVVRALREDLSGLAAAGRQLVEDDYSVQALVRALAGDAS